MHDFACHTIFNPYPLLPWHLSHFKRLKAKDHIVNLIKTNFFFLVCVMGYSTTD